MTAELHFFPLGNADTLLMSLSDGSKVLIDYANMRNPDEPEDKRCDLAEELRRDLRKARRDRYDVVCITHLDDDHCKGFGEFFWLDHADKYQDGERIKIEELWVPAGAIVEEGLKGDARLVRAEARHRLKQGAGIRVFSRPAQLDSFLEENGIDPEDRDHLIVDAGQLVPGYTKEGAKRAEFFVHCPFGWKQDEESEVIDRNQNSIVMRVTLSEGQEDTHMLLGSDVDYESIEQIVQTTRRNGNEDRLRWDLMKLFHHCSYTALGPERGEDETEATEDVRWLFEEQGGLRAVIVSPSKPIPSQGSKEDEDTQPPHRQAANHHTRVVEDLDGSFEVTMERPSKTNPKPFGYRVTTGGLAPIVALESKSAAASLSTPRAG